MKIFIPYLYKTSPELLYTLRSIEKYIPHTGVVLCGMRVPDWIQNVEFYFYEDLTGNIHKGNNTHGKMIHCLDALGEDFIAYNDDYYLLAPWSFDNYFSKTLSQIHKPNDWGNAVKNTINKIGDVASFEVHCPIVFNADKLEKLYLPNVDYGWCVKTIYAHTYKLTRIEYPDMKLRSRYSTHEEIKQLIQGRKFFSTYPTSWNDAMISLMEELYPEKSRYEK